MLALLCIICVIFCVLFIQNEESEMYHEQSEEQGKMFCCRGVSHRDV